MHKIRILHILPTLSRAGTEAFVMNCLRGIDKSRFELAVFSLTDKDDDYGDEIRRLGATLFVENLSFSSVWTLPKNFCRFTRILKSIDYDILHCHVSSICGFIFLASYFAGKKRCVAHSHFSVYDKPTGSFLRRLLYGRFSRFLMLKLGKVFCACSKESAEALYGPGPSCTFINNGIDIDCFAKVPEASAEKLRVELNIPEGVKVYGNISRYESPKNIPFVVDVFNEIHKMQPDSMLLLAGRRGSLYDETRSKVLSYGLEKDVIMLETRADVNVLMKVLDCVIFPSLNEGFSFSLIEAQTSSLPVLASDSLSEKMDFGLGLVYFLSLADGPEVWARKAISVGRADIDYLQIKEHLEDYDIRHSVKKLERVYCDLMQAISER